MYVCMYACYVHVQKYDNNNNYTDINTYVHTSNIELQAL